MPENATIAKRPFSSSLRAMTSLFFWSNFALRPRGSNEKSPGARPEPSNISLSAMQEMNSMPAMAVSTWNADPELTAALCARIEFTAWTSPGSFTNSVIMKPSVASMAMRPCLSSERETGI
jgi:hypothetical protein